MSSPSTVGAGRHSRSSYNPFRRLARAAHGLRRRVGDQRTFILRTIRRRHRSSGSWPRRGSSNCARASSGRHVQLTGGAPGEANLNEGATTASAQRTSTVFDGASGQITDAHPLADLSITAARLGCSAAGGPRIPRSGNDPRGRCLTHGSGEEAASLAASTPRPSGSVGSPADRRRGTRPAVCSASSARYQHVEEDLDFTLGMLVATVHELARAAAS